MTAKLGASARRARVLSIVGWAGWGACGLLALLHLVDWGLAALLGLTFQLPRWTYELRKRDDFPPSD